ncbi:hypothetical protein A4157S1_280245 [Escherichia coli]|nr:hypothetical protein HMVEC_840029 [Escherichia coli]SOQ67248.1 hypothetical protein A4157S1_280245 [Escherichia coli]SOQ94441.1 hypothetical protein NC86S1_730015 [Escherichia coli]VEW07613.1 hypothetical protein CRJUMX01_620119 [Escherichia coli]
MLEYLFSIHSKTWHVLINSWPKPF